MLLFLIKYFYNTSAICPCIVLKKHLQLKEDEFYILINMSCAYLVHKQFLHMLFFYVQYKIYSITYS